MNHLLQIEIGDKKDSEKADQVARAIVALAQGKHLLFGIDRDGTLVAYADRPEVAVLHPYVHALMCKLADCPNVTAAVVSARSTAQLRGEFDEQKLILAGNYGLEICYPQRSTNGTLHKSAAKALKQTNTKAAHSAPTLKAARDELAVLIRAETAAILEDHGYSLCLHWHTVPTEMRPNLHRLVADIAKKFPDLHWRAQPTSYEVLPALDWSKASALAAIAGTIAATSATVSAGTDAAAHDATADDSTPLLGGQNTMPLAYVFIGDSAADEPAFAWVNERNGISVKVGSAGGGTVSTYQLADTKETEALLARLVDYLKQAG